MEGVEGWVAEEDPKAAEIPEWDPEGDPLAQQVVYGAVKRKDVTGLDPDGRKEALAAESARQKEKLDALAEKLRELRATVTDVNGGMKWATEAASAAAVEREIHRVAKPYVEAREDLLTRTQGAKVSVEEATQLRETGRARYSALGVANAADPRLPVYGTVSCALLRDRVYLFGDEQERDAFLQRPLQAMKRPLPTRRALVSSTVVLGPPLSGKSTQARLLAKKLGAVYVTVEGMLEDAISGDTPFAGELALSLMSGTPPISDKQLVEALVGRLTMPDCITKGWVVDGFPQTLQQAELLATYGFRPQVVYCLELSEAQSMACS
jgi:hypothetical protein